MEGGNGSSQAECRRFEPVHPLFTSAIRLPSVLTPLWMPASPSQRHPPGSQRKFVASGCPRLALSTCAPTCPPPSNGPFTKSVGACPEFRIPRGKNGRGCSDYEQPLRQIWLACSRNSGRELRRSLPGSAVPADLNDFVVAATVPTRHQRRPATSAQEPHLMRPRC